ncbi:MAG: hypothetical protein GEU78_17360 [Actinobacteria bacterium]|nr:hypothetical protein [Actinomycetota bacterium]
MHRFLIHKRGDHVGVATADIADGEKVLGAFMDDESTIEVLARAPIRLGHKIAIKACRPGEPVLEYGVRIGQSPDGFEVGDYVHTHNLRSARW